MPANKIKETLDNIIDKMTTSGGNEKIAITRFGKQNIYSISKGVGIVYDDIERIDALLSTLNGYSINERIASAKTILYGFFRITQGVINKKIKVEMTNINTIECSRKEQLCYELFLVAIEIVQPRQELPSDIESLIDSIDKKTTYSTEAIGLQEQLNYIVKKLSLKTFSKALRKIKKITARFND